MSAPTRDPAAPPLVEIVKGLKAGDRVALNPGEKVKDGAAVAIAKK